MIYGVTPFIKSQKKVIEEVCFGTCGKILAAAVNIGRHSFFACSHDDCKHEDGKTPIMGQTFNGEDFCVRKLKEDSK